MTPRRGWPAGTPEEAPDTSTMQGQEGSGGGLGSRLGGVALAQAAGAVAFLTVASKVLGFLREAALAKGFGATAATDAYLVAQAIPTLLFAVGTGLGMAFIPLLAEALDREGRDAAYRFASTVMNASVGVAAVVVIVGELLALPVVRLAAPGFAPETLELAVSLTRYMFPMIIFQALNGLFTSILQTEGSFGLPASVALLFNVIIIASIVWLGPVFGVTAVAWGTTGAMAAQALVQFVALRLRGFRWRASLDWHDPRLRRLGILLVPLALGSLIVQVGPLVEKILASGLAEGSISALGYGTKLVGLPYGVVGGAMTTVLYPTLSRLASVDDKRQLRLAVSRVLGMANFLLVPLAVGLVLLREPIVALAFERGRFDAAATSATATVVLFLAAGVLGMVLRDFLSRVFYSLQDTVTPVVVGAAGVGINIAFNLLLVTSLKQGGLALGASLGALSAAVSLLWLLRRRLGGLGLRGVLASLWRVLLASLAMGVAVTLAGGATGLLLPGAGLVFQTLRLGIRMVVGGVVYGVTSALLKVPELHFAWRLGPGVLRHAPRSV